MHLLDEVDATNMTYVASTYIKWFRCSEFLQTVKLDVRLIFSAPMLELKHKVILFRF